MVSSFSHSFYFSPSKRRRALPSLAILLCVLFGCAAETSRPVVRSVPRSERTDLVVLDFVNNTSGARASEFQPWELGLASMMMTDLESMGLFNIISRDDVRDISRKRGLQLKRVQTEENALEVGRLVSARYVLAGSFLEMTGKLRVEARVFSVEQGMQLGAASVDGKTDEFFELQKQLVIEISPYLEAVLDDAETSIIAMNIETTSVHASLNNYAGEIAVLQAQECRERGEPQRADKFLEEAKHKFQTALKHDPDYKLSLIHI